MALWTSRIYLWLKFRPLCKVAVSLPSIAKLWKVWYSQCRWIFKWRLFINSLDHCIDGPAFVELSEGEIREMVPPIGLVKKVMAVIPKVSLWVLRSLAVMWILEGLVECFVANDTRWCLMFSRSGWKRNKTAFVPCCFYECGYAWANYLLWDDKCSAHSPSYRIFQ